MNPAATLSLIIPVYNERQHLEEFLAKLDQFDFGVPTELIIVDDCSKDGSRDILQAWKFKKEARLFFQEKNQGKGAAIQRGLQEARGDVVMVQDADFEYDLRDVPGLVAPILAGEAEVVYGSRFRKDRAQVHRTFHYLVNRTLTILSNLLSGLYLTDMETCYKAFRREIIQNIRLESRRFGFEPEVTAKIARLQLRVQELPIRYYPRNYQQGKKINWKDGVAALWHIFRFNCLVKADASFTEALPPRYRISSRQWL
jgi:glycosyltransferase involved in cell wall biosynthesis